MSSSSVKEHLVRLLLCKVLTGLHGVSQRKLWMVRRREWRRHEALLHPTTGQAVYNLYLI